MNGLLAGRMSSQLGEHAPDLSMLSQNVANFRASAGCGHCNRASAFEGGREVLTRTGQS